MATPQVAPRAASLAPTPLAPEDGAVVPLDAAVFRWTAPPGGVYTLRIASADAPDAPVAEIGGLATTEATLAQALAPSPYIWWVRRDDGPWSAAAHFVAGTPADIEAVRRDEAASARQHRQAERAVKASGLLTEAPPEPVWPHATGDALDDVPPLDWFAVPGFEIPRRSVFHHVDLDPPRPLGPLGGEVVDAVSVTIQWTPVAGAFSYDVEITPDSTFGRDVLSLEAPATEVTLPGLLPSTGHRLFWRVRAKTAEGVTPWSRYGRFYPADGAAVDAFRRDLDSARVAQHRRREHERLVEARERDLVPAWERSDAVTDMATLAVLLAMMLSGVGIGIAVLAFSLIRF